MRVATIINELSKTPLLSNNSEPLIIYAQNKISLPTKNTKTKYPVPPTHRRSNASINHLNTPCPHKRVSHRFENTIRQATSEPVGPLKGEKG